jgi:hypothetical protein
MMPAKLVIPERASSREPGIQASCGGKAVWIPGSACGGPGMTKAP